MDSRRQPKYEARLIPGGSRALRAKASSSVSGNKGSKEPKWLRSVVTALAVGGLLETSFLSVKELLDPVASFCPTEGCKAVLNSEYADVFGIPSALFGLFAFGVFTFVSVYPFLSSDKEEKVQKIQETKLPMVGISTAMAVFSAYNLSVMGLVLHAFCQFCIASAFISFLLFGGSVASSLYDPSTREKTQQSVGLSSLVSALLVAGVFFTAGVDADDLPFISDDELTSLETTAEGYREPTSQLATTLLASPQELTPSSSKSDLPFAPPAITAKSSEYAKKLSKHLQSKHVKMYGAYWCSHCYNQKQMFGKEAFANIEYIECDKRGYQSQNKLCKEKGLPGYPTWEIDGELYPGEMELKDLAVFSEFVN